MRELSENTFQSFNMEVYEKIDPQKQLTRGHIIQIMSYVETFQLNKSDKNLKILTFYINRNIGKSQRRSDLLTNRNDNI